MKLTATYDDAQINLKADATSLHELAREILRLHGVCEWPLIKPPIELKAPHQNFADSLKIEIIGDRIVILLDKNKVIITGSEEMFKKLAQNIEFASENTASKHLHVEFYPGHFFLDSKSAPLIITRID